MSEIKRMKAYLVEAEAFVDTVYHFAQEKEGSVADELRMNMNHIANVLGDGRDLLDKMGMPKKEMIEKLEIAQGLLSSVYHDACDFGDSEIETAMSIADGCINDAMSKLEE